MPRQPNSMQPDTVDVLSAGSARLYGRWIQQVPATCYSLEQPNSGTLWVGNNSIRHTPRLLPPRTTPMSSGVKPRVRKGQLRKKYQIQCRWTILLMMMMMMMMMMIPVDMENSHVQFVNHLQVDPFPWLKSPPCSTITIASQLQKINHRFVKVLRSLNHKFS